MSEDRQKTQQSINDLINNITKENKFIPVENENSTGLSPDLSDGDIEGIIKRSGNNNSKVPGYRYYFDEDKGILYKSGYQGSLEEYIGDCLWNYVLCEELLDMLTEVTEEEADNIIKEIEGDEYDLVDGYVLEDFKGDM
ncbi:MAG: hypothetical protein IKW30_00500 [Lachnospiraceae bacterium]|nr:hypothetical protein [Lachnospiraceae bacterium]